MSMRALRPSGASDSSFPMTSAREGQPRAGVYSSSRALAAGDSSSPKEPTQAMKSTEKRRIYRPSAGREGIDHRIAAGVALRVVQRSRCAPLRSAPGRLADEHVSLKETLF